MGRPLDTHTDKELEGVLAEGELTERKAAVAEEILRRRQDAKAEAIKEKNGWIGGILGYLGFSPIRPQALLAKATQWLVVELGRPRFRLVGGANGSGRYSGRG